MKKQILIAGLMFISAAGLAQKKELKKAEKAMGNQETAEALNYLGQAEALLGSADNSQKVHFYVLKGEATLVDAGASNFDKMKAAAESFKKAEELGPSGDYVKRLEAGRQNLRVAIVNSAIADQKTQNYAGAAEKLHTSYMVSKKDTADLYYAAGNAVNGKDYTTALKYYEQLMDLGFTGIKTEYLATSPEGQEIDFGNTEERDKAVMAFGYTNPNDRVAPSVKGDILQKLTYIYLDQGQNDKAIEVMKEARAANPGDITLIRTEADLAYKMGDIAKYNSLMQEVIASDPNNPELYYNLGVSAAKIDQKDKAMEYYKKSLEIDPNFTNAKINIAALILSGEGAIVEEMNGLGMSRKDEQRYDELKAQRNNMYLEVIPYLESAVQAKGDNVELVRTLMNIYTQVGQDDKYKAMKAKLQALEGGQ